MPGIPPKFIDHLSQQDEMIPEPIKAPRWDLGQEGKAYLHPDGQLYIWDRNEPSRLGMSVHHPEIVRHFEGRTTEDQWKTVANRLFEVEPDGELVQSIWKSDGEPMFEKAIAQDPRLKPPSGKDPWHFGKLAGETNNWAPGFWGKGFSYNDRLHAWPVGGPSLTGEGPHHMEVFRKFYNDVLPPKDQIQALRDGDIRLYRISPEGEIDDCLKGDAVPDHVLQQDPRLKRPPEDKWHFASWPSLYDNEDEDEEEERSYGGHVLEWNPGEQGRGFIRRNGEVHTWGNESGKYDDNYHHDAEYIKGLRPHEGAGYFFIDEHGQFDGVSPAQADQVLDADSRLSTRPPGAIHFGAWTPPDTSGPAEVVELPPDQVRKPTGADSLPDDIHAIRRPFVYHEEDHQVVIGPTNTYHQQIDPNRNGMKGIIWTDGRGGNVQCFDPVPEHVMGQLSEQFGTVRGKDDWHFAVWEPPAPFWQPGHHGKFIVTPEQKVYAWQTTSADGQPSHFEYCEKHPELDGEKYGNDLWTSAPQYTAGWIEPTGHTTCVKDAANKHEHAKLLEHYVPGTKVHLDEDEHHFGAAQADPWHNPEFEDDDAWDQRMTEAMQDDMARVPTDEEVKGLIQRGVVHGEEGKGLTTPDGKSYRWKAHGEFGWPHHDDVARLLGLRKYDPFFIDREGNESTLEDEISGINWKF